MSRSARKSRFGGVHSGNGGGISSGFTLLEVLIAITIIAVGFMAVFSLHLESVSVIDRVRFYTVATGLARKKLADMSTAGSQGTIDDSGDFGEAFTGYTWKITEEELTSESLGETLENFKKFTLEIQLNDGENSYSVTAYRYVVPKER